MPPDLDATPQLYLGKFTRTIWHNSTTVLLTRLSIIVFFLVRYYLTAERIPRWPHVAVAGSIILNAAAKPNFMLVFLPAAGLLCLWLLAHTPRAVRLRRSADSCGDSCSSSAAAR